MAKFDPDAYLNEPTGGASTFDPDAYLGGGFDPDAYSRKERGAGPISQSPEPMVDWERIYRPQRNAEGKVDRSVLGEAAASVSRYPATLAEGIGGTLGAIGSAADSFIENSALGPIVNRRTLDQRSIGQALRRPAPTNVVTDATRAAGASINQGAKEAVRDNPRLQASQTIKPFSQDPLDPQWWAANAPESAVQLAGQLALAAGTGGGSALVKAASFAAPTAVQTTGQTYNEALARHGNQGDAAKESILSGGIQTGLEAVPFKAIMGAPKAGPAILARARATARGAGSEAATEAAQEYSGDVVASEVGGDAKAFEGAKDRYLGSAAVGGVLGAGASAAFSQPSGPSGPSGGKPASALPPPPIPSVLTPGSAPLDADAPTASETDSQTPEPIPGGEVVIPNGLTPEPAQGVANAIQGDVSLTDPAPSQTTAVAGAPVVGSEITLAPESPVATPSAPILNEATAMVDSTMPRKLLVKDIHLSEDVPNFKADANEETGVVPGKELRGKLRKVGFAPIVVWERLTGRLEIITGRHRLDKVRREGEAEILSYVVREADGFTKDHALVFDAESNILDNQGEAKDYAQYFKKSPITEAEAEQGGLLRGSKGNSGWHLGRNATDALYDQWANGGLDDRRAVAIASAAPGNEAVQLAGITYATGPKKPTADQVKFYVRALMHHVGETRARGPKVGDQPDMFDFNDFALQESAAIGDAAHEIQSELKSERALIGSPSKNADRLREIGVDVRDPEALRARYKELNGLIEAWEKYETRPKLWDEARKRAGIKDAESNIFTESQETVTPPPPPPKTDTGQKDMFASQAQMNVGASVPDERIGLSGAHEDIGDMFGDTSKQQAAEAKLAAQEAAKNGPKAKQGKLDLSDSPAPDNESLMMFAVGRATSNMPLDNAGVSAPIRGADIISWAERTFKVPIRGKATHQMSKTAGFYNRKQELIRLKEHGDLETASHELAHHLERGIFSYRNRGRRRHFAGFEAELGALDYDQTKQRPFEGFAEYVRHFMMEGDADVVAPTWHPHFWRYLETNRPDVAREMIAMRGFYQQWMDQGSKDRILSQIDGTELNAIGKPTLMDRGRAAMLKLRTMFIDSVSPLEVAMKQSGVDASALRPSQDPVKLARALKEKAPAMARELVMEGVRDISTGQMIGPGLRQIMEPIAAKGKKETADFLAYTYARRAVELYGRGINPGILLRDANHVVQQSEAAHPEWAQSAQQLTDWNKHLLDILVDAGSLSPETADLVESLNLSYIPLKRVFVDELGVKSGGKKGSVNLGKGINRIKGSGRPIYDPLESMVQNATEIIQHANKVRVASALANLADKQQGFGRFVSKVPPPTEVQKVKTGDVLRALQEADALPKDPATGQPLPLDTANLDGLMTFFSQGKSYKGKDNVVSIWRNGEQEFYELHPEIFRVLTEMDSMFIPGYAQFLTAPAKMVRLGATGLRPSFAAANFFRDTLNYALAADKSKLGPLDPIVGVYDRLRKTEFFKLARANGIELSTHIGQDRDLLRAMKKRILSVTPKQKAAYVIRHPVQTLQELISIPEIAPRLVEAERTYNEAMQKYGAHKDAIIEAVNAGQDVTVNFTRSGTVGRIINQVYPFWNAQVQGLDKIARTAKAHPVRTTARALAYLTVPTILQWILNRDEDWYQELNAWEKSSYWHFKVGAGADGRTIVWRLPKPYEYGSVFAGTPEVVLDARYNRDPQLVNDAISAMSGAIVPDMLPWDMAVSRPAVEVLANKNFAGTPIVPERLKDAPPEEQFTENTGEIYKAIGGWTGTSPLQLEHLASGYSGGASRSAMGTADGVYGLADGTGFKINNVPLIGRFVLRNPNNPARSMELFYNEMDKLRLEDDRDTISTEDLNRLLLLEAANRDFTEIRSALRETTDPMEKDALRRTMALRVRGVLGRKPTRGEVESLESGAAETAARRMAVMGRVSAIKAKVGRSGPQAGPTRRAMLLRQLRRQLRQNQDSQEPGSAP